MRVLLRSALALAGVVLLGCWHDGGHDDNSATPRAARLSAAAMTEVRLVPVPDALVAACHTAQRRASYPFLCPARLPRPSRYYPPLEPSGFGALWAGRRAGIVDVSYGVGFAATFPRSNQPQEFLHFVVGRATHGIPRNARSARLGGRRGLLAPASSVSAYGGRYFANHVRFLWRQHGIRYVASLHTFGERATEQLLDRILRTARPARRLSPARPGGPGAARVAVPAAPTDLVLAPPGLYATSRGTDFAPGSRVTRIDNGSLATSRLEGVPEHGTRLAAARGALWAAGSSDSPDPDFFTPPWLARIDPKTGRVTARVSLGSDRDTAPTGIVAGGQSVWVALTDFDQNRDRGRVWRLDADTGRVLAKVRVGRLPGAMAIEGDSLWVVSTRYKTVSRIDGETSRVKTYRVSSEPAGIIADHGSIWLTHPRAGTVSRIEPASGRQVATIPVGGSAYAMAADERGVWIALPGEGVVRRIDAETNSVAETIEIGGDPFALASDGQFLWVISSSDALVLRIPPATLNRAGKSPGATDNQGT